MRGIENHTLWKASFQCPNGKIIQTNGDCRFCFGEHPLLKLPSTGF